MMGRLNRARRVALWVMLLCFMGVSFVRGAEAHGDRAVNKEAVLAVAFGTSIPGAEKAIMALKDAAAKAVPGAEVRLAYTSNIIRRKLAREKNLHIPTPMEALAQLQDEGYNHVWVMPMHMIPGEEYDDLRNVVDAFASVKGKYAFKELKLGTPFLENAEGCQVVAKVIFEHFATVLKDRHTAVVMMGHGTPEHPANAMYSLLQLALNRIKEGRVYIGTVEGAPDVEDVIHQLKKNRNIKKLVIAPLMIVAGDHATNDLAGKDDEESWLNVLKRAGYKNIAVHLMGMGQYPQMQRIFAEHLKEMVDAHYADGAASAKHGK